MTSLDPSGQLLCTFGVGEVSLHSVLQGVLCDQSGAWYACFEDGVMQSTGCLQRHTPVLLSFCFSL